ncbi:hypothetical protein ACFSSA_07095 [Luteolibacter algae]|uniref:ATP-binding protein n=1 Tax=Luteolibacter algae TaxID=454151 RepID=A0ABW5D7S3_9BACT
MPSEHPFQKLFETFGKLPEAHSENVNSEARASMKAWLDVALEKPGHCILLKAPRAGHGKTHLLTRLQHELGGTHEFIPIQATGGSRIDAVTVLEDTLRRLVRGLPAAGGLTVLDLVARRLFSSSLQPLVRSGEVPCQDREGALNALRTRPIETFDFHHPSAVTAHWARENFELLGPRLALELSQRNGLSLREVSFWVDAMFRFSATAIDNPGRSRALSSSVFDEPGSESVAHERLVALLGLTTSLLRVVLVSDELEGFSADESAALKFASFIGSLRQSVERLEIIISINQDVWESAFLPRLSGGLADRLSEVEIELKALKKEEMLEILESRSPGYGERILAEMDGGNLPEHARGLIKEAAETWEKASSKVSGQNDIREPGAKPVDVEAEIPEENAEVQASNGTTFDDEPETKSVFAAGSASFATPPMTSDFIAKGHSLYENAAPTPEQAPKESVVEPVSLPDFSGTFLRPAVAGKEPESASFSPQPRNSSIEEESFSWPSPEISESRFDIRNSFAKPSEAEAEPEKSQEEGASQAVPTESASKPTAESQQDKPADPISHAESSEPVFQAAGSDYQPAKIIEPGEREPQVPPAPSTPPPFQAAPPVSDPRPDANPFQAAPPNPEPKDTPPPFQAAPPATDSPPEQPFQTIAPSSDDDSREPSTDRVDDLLRQFRERYGKG